MGNKVKRPSAVVSTERCAQPAAEVIAHAAQQPIIQHETLSQISATCRPTGFRRIRL